MALTADERLERLAQAIHNLWMGWAVHAAENVDAKTRKRWAPMLVPYGDLPEDEKQKDRVEAIALLEALDADDVQKSHLVFSVPRALRKAFRMAIDETPDAVEIGMEQHGFKVKREGDHHLLVLFPGALVDLWFDFDRVRVTGEEAGAVEAVVGFLTRRFGAEVRDTDWESRQRQMNARKPGMRKGFLTTGYGEGRAPHKTPDAGKRVHQTAAVDAATSEESLPTIRLNGFTPNVAWALLRRAGYVLRITDGEAMLPGQTTIRVSSDGVITLQGAKAARYAAWFNAQLKDMVDWAGQIDGKQEVSSIRSHGGQL